MQILTSFNLTKSYNKRKVVDKVSLQIAQGEIVGLLGPNGAGKTTTFYMLVGLLRPDSGKIYINDLDVTYLPMYKRARQGIGYLPQEPSIFRKLTVEENILAILESLKLTKEERQVRLSSLLEELGIAHLAKNKAYTLSGGERRRVEIARALVISPSFILFDEPFAGIDPITVFDIQKIVFQLKEKGIGVLITDHRVRETLEVTDRAYIMYEGRIVLSGTSAELATSEKAKAIYLGERFAL